MFWVAHPEAVRVPRYWLAPGAPGASLPKDEVELYVTRPLPEAACRTPPPKTPLKLWISPPFLSIGETISQPRRSGNSKVETAACVTILLISPLIVPELFSAAIR